MKSEQLTPRLELCQRGHKHGPRISLIGTWPGSAIVSEVEVGKLDDLVQLHAALTDALERIAASQPA